MAIMDVSGFEPKPITIFWYVSKLRRKLYDGIGLDWTISNEGRRRQRQANILNFFINEWISFQQSSSVVDFIYSNAAFPEHLSLSYLICGIQKINLIFIVYFNAKLINLIIYLWWMNIKYILWRQIKFSSIAAGWSDWLIWLAGWRVKWPNDEIDTRWSDGVRAFIRMPKSKPQSVKLTWAWMFTWGITSINLNINQPATVLLDNLAKENIMTVGNKSAV